MNKIIFPQKCIFCGKVIEPHKLFCESCNSKALAVGLDSCKACGRDFEQCYCKIGDFAFKRNISCFYYKGSVKTLIYRFKFRKKPLLAVPMSAYMLSAIYDKYYNFTFDAVTYVPDHFIKRMFRGYNTSKLLAEHIANALNLPLEDTLLSKFRFKSQKRQSKRDRIKSIKGKFKIKGSDVKGKNILLVDDVMTTGSTLSECAKILKKAGADEIYCVTFAITCKK